MKVEALEVKDVACETLVNDSYHASSAPCAMVQGKDHVENVIGGERYTLRDATVDASLLLLDDGWLRIA